MAEVAPTPPLLQLRQISKAFGGVQALADVDFTLRRGTVHALIGENGAGKSTLMKILSGAHRPDHGQVLIDGSTQSFHSPHAARACGIAMIYQELTLAPDLNVEQNIVLGAERATVGFARSSARPVRDALARLGHPDLPLDLPVGKLPIGQQQIVEIARALVGQARIIIMDEPTSSLSRTDTLALFQATRNLRDAGLAVVYISHFLEEVMEIGDEFTVLRDGRTVGSGNVADTSITTLVGLMVGRQVDELFPKIEHPIGDPILSLQAVSGQRLPKQASLELRAGEILGLAGLVGAGRSELLRAAFGLHPVAAGTLTATTTGSRPLPLSRLTPGKALASGLALLSENRKEEGLATQLTIADNIMLATLPRHARPKCLGLLRQGELETAAATWIDRLGIRCRDGRQIVDALSGGNQQKVALARLLESQARILLLDEPTRGVDVGSKVEIYRLIFELAAAGKGIVFVSSYLPELFGVCDTLAVMHRGRLSPKRDVSRWTPEEVMQLATSGSFDDQEATP